MQPIEGNPTGIQAYRLLLKMAFEHRLYFVIAITGMLIFAASDAAFAYIMKPLMDEGFVHRDPEVIRLIPIAIVGIFVVRMFAVFMRTYCMSYIGRAVINSLRGMMFEKLLTMTSDEYDQAPTATIVTRFSYDVEQVAKSVSTSLTAFIQDSLRIIVLLGYMLWLNWQLTTIFLVAGPVVFIIVARISGRFRGLSRKIQQSMGVVTRVAQEVIDANQVVKIFGGDEFERDKFSRANEKNLKQNLKLTIAQAISMPLIQLVVAIAFAAIVAFATSDAMRDVITTGDFVSFIFAMTMLLAPARTLSSINAQIQKGIAAGESVFELTSRDSERDSGTLPLERAEGRLRFDDVALCYRRSDARVLDEISFDVEPNQTIAIVGRSGSGKTSLVNLIPRLYEHDSGEILLDGKPLDQYRLSDLRRQIAYVGQDVRLFNDSIRNNIAYGIADQVDEARIVEAARRAHAWEFIQEMPDGLDTEVGERGVLLSGGQRQRIAIARALLKNAPILILDEATSALDSESERLIQEGMEELMQNRTTLVIAHRLSTIEHADHILVMEQGRIIEQGNHRELLERGGVYARLHSLQFRDDKGDRLKPSDSPPPIGGRVRLNKARLQGAAGRATRKRQGWWLWSINPVSMLLLPLAGLYYLATFARREAYRYRLLRAQRLAVTTVVVGNITVGGNGKTPVVMALFRLLRDNGYRPAILTRGYKSGHETSIQLLHDGDIQASAGDEANMVSEICRCPIGVGADRIGAARLILERFPDIDVLLADDGLQHYQLARDLEIAVHRQLSAGNGLMLPAGPLREPAGRLDTVDIVIDRDSEQVVESLGEVWNLLQPELRRHISEFRGKPAHALAGIGFPQVFFSSLEQMEIQIIAHEFPDHHEFSVEDLSLTPDLPILVTHKDAVKLKSMARENIWVVPLHIDLDGKLAQEILDLLEKRHHG